MFLSSQSWLFHLNRCLRSCWFNSRGRQAVTHVHSHEMDNQCDVPAEFTPLSVLHLSDQDPSMSYFCHKRKLFLRNLPLWSWEVRSALSPSQCCKFWWLVGVLAVSQKKKCRALILFKIGWFLLYMSSFQDYFRVKTNEPVEQFTVTREETCHCRCSCGCACACHICPGAILLPEEFRGLTGESDVTRGWQQGARAEEGRRKPFACLVTVWSVCSAACRTCPAILKCTFVRHVGGD